MSKISCPLPNLNSLEHMKMNHILKMERQKHCQCFLEWHLRIHMDNTKQFLYPARRPLKLFLCLRSSGDANVFASNDLFTFIDNKSSAPSRGQVCSDLFISIDNKSSAPSRGQVCRELIMYSENLEFFQI